MRRFLEGAGELGHDLLAVDWGSTPLGDPDQWPYALRNSVRILLTSKFSMWMAWGPELTFLCNDAYRRDTLSKKYPWALGRPASEVWSEIWTDIEPRIDGVMETGEATWDESLQLFLERSGYVEETYHTFSYSPLVDDENVIRGMLCVVKEDTEEVIAARRMSTLGDLGTRSGDLNESQTIASACQHLAANPWSLPFTLTYLFDADGSTARLAGKTGFTDPHPAAPEQISVNDPDAAWPADQLTHGEAVTIEDLGDRFPSLPTGEWPDPPCRAVVVPLLQPGQPVPYGFLVVGANPYRPLDERYLSFMRLIAGHLAGAITDARAFEFERQRAETLAELDRAEQGKAEAALATAAAFRQAAQREHAIADELQRSLLPERSFDLEHLDVATYYRAGVEGTQVGGDWYDTIELGAGRSALVVGDVMGRGVSAAAAMGQLRSAVRAFAKLDLPPSEVLEYLDGMVADLSGDQIVTCVYAVFDSTDQTLRYANAGHLPLLLSRPGQETEKLGAAGPPLGAGFFGQPTETVQLSRGCTVAFYTDGLVERRERDIDAGIEGLAEQLQMLSSTDLTGMPETLVAALLPDGPDDDIAILVARVNQDPFANAVHHRLGLDEPAVSNARRVVMDTLAEWEVPQGTIDEVVLMASELVTNAFLHGRSPIDLRLRVNRDEVTFEVQDRAPYRPRRRRAHEDDENGRGLQIVSILADRWGSRATGTGKSVWCTLAYASKGESSIGMADHA